MLDRKIGDAQNSVSWIFQSGGSEDFAQEIKKLYYFYFWGFPLAAGQQINRWKKKKKVWPREKIKKKHKRKYNADYVVRAFIVILFVSSVADVVDSVERAEIG